MNNVRIIDIRVFIDNVEYKDIYMGKGDTIKGMEKSSNVDGLDFGVAMSKQIEVGIHDPSHKLNSGVRGSKLRIEYSVINDNSQSVVFNEFRIHDSYRRGNSYTVLGEDKMSLAEENLSKIINKKTATIGEYINAIVSRIGLTGHNLPKNISSITINIEPSRYSARGFIGEVSALNGGFARITRNDSLEFLNIRNQYNNAISKDFSNMIKTDSVDEPITINGLVYAQEIRHGNAPALIIPFNNLLESMSNKEEIINNIYNQVKGITYTPVSGELYYIPFIQAGDFFKANSYNGNYITVASDIEYELGGLITFRNSGLAITDNLAINARSPVEEDEPEEPEPPEPETPEFELEIIDINKYKPEDSFIIEGNYFPQETDDIWVRLDTIDYLKFMGDNYDGMDYMMPGTKGYETFEGEYGEGTYTLKEINDYMDYYKRYITPKTSMELVDWLEELDDKMQKENIINFDRYMRIENGILWVKAFVSNNKLYIPSSYKYTIKLKNNDFKEGFQVYDDMYYIGYGTVRLVDKNNLTWYGLPNILDTYISDKIIMEHKLFTYMPSDNISEHYKSKDIYVEGTYDDLDKDVVGKNIGGILINNNKFKGSSRLVENENEDDSNYMYIKFNSTNSFLDRINERSDLYTDYDKEHRILNIPTGAKIYTNELWAKSPKNFQSYYNGESMTIPYWYYKQVDWEWNFWREGYLLDKYRAFDSVEYYPDIRVLMRPKAGTTKDHVKDMFIYEEAFRDYETEYTDRKITHIVLDDINNRGEQTEEFEFKPFTDKNRVIYDRKMNYSGVGGGFDYHSDFTRFTQFYFYKDGGKERVNMGTIFQEDIEHFDGEYISDRLDRAADEFGYVYAMNVVDREDNRYTIPVDQYKSGSMENGPWVMYIAEARISRSVSNGLDRKMFNTLPMIKEHDKYYWILNVDAAGPVLELKLLNNLNKELDLYTIKNKNIINKYSSLVSDLDEAIFLLDNDDYDQLLIVGEYSADLKEGILYTENRESNVYRYYDKDISYIKDINNIEHILK